MGRHYYKDKAHSDRILGVIASHYNELKQKLCPVVYGNYTGRSTEDIFSDTIMFVIEDKATEALSTDEEILKHFVYRFNMISYQVIKDSCNERTTQCKEQLRDKGREV